MVGCLSRLDAIKLAVARGVARSGVKRALDHLQLEMAYVRSSRVLAHGKDNWETEQLEAIACQLAGVGGGHGLNQAHAGPWRYAVGRGRRDDTLIVFLATLCARGWGDRPLGEARFDRALDTDTAPWRRAWSSGATAADRFAEGSFAADTFGSPDGLLAATPRQILSALGSSLWAKVAALKARFSGLDLDGLIYATAMTPAGESYYAWLAAQARVKRRKQLGSAPPPDVQRAAVVAIHAAVLETTGYVDSASDDARAASSNAADFEALRQRDADLVSRTRENPGASSYAQCAVLKERLEAAGFGVEGWDTSRTPENTTFLRFQLAKAREAARKRFGRDASKLRAALTEIRTIFREAADFEDDACADAFDAAAFDALAAADADVVSRARAAGGSKSGGGSVAKFPQKLAELVTQHAGVVFWDETARELVIVDQARLEREVLPLYFNMKGLHGFRVQLYIYGFSKVNRSANYGSRPKVSVIYSNTVVADLAKLVRRKSGKAAAPSVATPPAPQPVAAVAARPVGRGAAAADAALDARSLQAAAAPAPVVAPPAAPAPVVASPALVSPVAAGASPKRPRAPSPKSVAPPVWKLPMNKRPQIVQHRSMLWSWRRRRRSGRGATTPPLCRRPGRPSSARWPSGRRTRGASGRKSSRRDSPT